MKYKLSIFLLLISCLLMTIGCQQEAFSTDPISSDFETPTDLVYFEIINAREYASVKTGIPSVNSGGHVPYFEIISGRKKDGTILDNTYMKDVSISNPIEENTNLPEEEHFEYEGDSIKTYATLNTRKNGEISIADDNNFGLGDFYFTIKVTVYIDEVAYETVFEDAFHLNVGPSLVTNLLYSPIAQNIVIGSGNTTTQPYLITGNSDVTFSLENKKDTLSIDPQTGVISLDASFATVEPYYMYPKVVVTSNISQETTEFQGESFLILVASNTAVTLPKQTNYFFYPTFQSENKLYGYEKTVLQPGSIAENKTWIATAAATLAETERPENVNSDIKALFTNMTAGDWEAHESILTINPQDLTQYSQGYDLSMVFYTKNQYVEYMSDGRTPSDLEIYISEDYTGDDATSTWTQINDQLSCQINSIDQTPFIGTPYPGDQKLGAGDPDGKKDNSRNADGKWVRNDFDLNAYKHVKNFALKFKIVANYEGASKPASGVIGRPGRYYVSDVHFKASEE
ncbi:MAG: hypothetical protein ACPHXR_06665 [Flavicella sp.]